MDKQVADTLAASVGGCRGREGALRPAFQLCGSPPLPDGDHVQHLQFFFIVQVLSDERLHGQRARLRQESTDHLSLRVDDELLEVPLHIRLRFPQLSSFDAALAAAQRAPAQHVAGILRTFPGAGPGFTALFLVLARLGHAKLHVSDVVRRACAVDVHLR
eukprot:scaffold228_cov312-Pinguiococcus_pyrenoidosus.AAC.51